jgi:Na+-driven multidrug efflux pump
VERLRSPHDREILRLAVPALGALAAEPLYVLADTAMVGHLGTEELAALAIAGTLVTGAFTLCNFLTYGTTAQVARLHGAGEELAAGRLAAQALWLSTVLGLLLAALLAGLAVPLVELMGADGRTAELAVTYLRTAAFGLPFALIALAGQGYLRTGDEAVIDKAKEIWLLFALMQPFNGAVFALDGILIGAGDTRFLMWGMLAASLGAFVPIALGSLWLELGIVGVWCGLIALIGVRLVTCAWRFSGRRWAVIGVGSA